MTPAEAVQAFVDALRINSDEEEVVFALGAALAATGERGIFAVEGRAAEILEHLNRAGWKLVRNDR